MAAPHVVLVECNRIDAQQHANDLSSLLGIPVSWVLIQNLPPARSADLFVVPYFHLDDVQEQLAGARIIGLHIAPEPAVLLEMLTSAQRPGARVGLVCGNSKSAVRFTKLIESYTTKSIEITHYRDPKGMARLVAACPRVYATPESYDTVHKLAPRKKLVLFPERIDPEALGPLRALLVDLKKTALARAAARPSAEGSRTRSLPAVTVP
jgi:hypothetical protein